MVERVQAQHAALRAGADPALPPGLGLGAAQDIDARRKVSVGSSSLADETGDEEDGAHSGAPSRASTPRMSLPSLPFVGTVGSGPVVSGGKQPTPPLTVAIPNSQEHAHQPPQTPATPGGSKGKFAWGRQKEKDKERMKGTPALPPSVPPQVPLQMAMTPSTSSSATVHSATTVATHATANGTSTDGHRHSVERLSTHTGSTSPSAGASANGSSSEWLHDARAPGMGPRPNSRAAKEEKKGWFTKRKSLRHSASISAEDASLIPQSPATILGTASPATGWTRSLSAVTPAPGGARGPPQRRMTAEPAALFVTPRMGGVPEPPLASAPLAHAHAPANQIPSRPPTANSNVGGVPPSPAQLPSPYSAPGVAPRTPEHKRSLPALATLGRRGRRGSTDAGETPLPPPPLRPVSAGAGMPASPVRMKPHGDDAPPVPPLPSSSALASTPVTSPPPLGGTRQTNGSGHEREDLFGTFPTSPAGVGLPASLSNGVPSPPTFPGQPQQLPETPAKQKRASRKLSFSGGLMGFGKKKDKDREHAQLASFGTVGSGRS